MSLFLAIYQGIFDKWRCQKEPDSPLFIAYCIHFALVLEETWGRFWLVNAFG